MTHNVPLLGMAEAMGVKSLAQGNNSSRKPGIECLEKIK